MNKMNCWYFSRFIAGLILSFSLFGLAIASQALPKHYPQQFDFDGHVSAVNISKQVIHLNGYPYNLGLATTAYGLKGQVISILSLTDNTKVGVILTPYVKSQKRVVSKIWVLPANYKLKAKPL